jgi:hypothetical protein
MPVYRITTGFSQANMGWSETWWTPDAEAPAVADLLNKELSLRAQMLWKIHSFIGVRIAQEGTRRKSVFLPAGNRFWPPSGTSIIIPATGARTGMAAGTRPDQLRAVVQLRISYGAGLSTLRYLSGVPDSITSTEPATDDFQGDPAWVGAYGAWKESIMADGWQIKVLDPAQPERAIRSLPLQQSAPGLVGIGVLTGESLSALPGDRIHIRGQRKKHSATDRRTMNGMWVVDSVNTTLTTGQVVYFLRNSEGIDPSGFQLLGSAQRVARTYADITSINVHRVGIHKRGRPFGTPVGRRSTRQSLDA